MATCPKFFVLSTVLTMVSAAFGQPTIVNFDFGAVPIECSSGYAYEGPVVPCAHKDTGPTQNFNASPGFGWILGDITARIGPPEINFGAGLTGPNTAFCPPSFDGMPFSQAVFLQGPGSFVWQAIGGFVAGSYTLSFYVGGRCGWSPQRIAALIDGTVIGTWDVPVGMPLTVETANFKVSTDGTHTLEFMGTNLGDATAFLSYVTITPAGRKAKS